MPHRARTARLTCAAVLASAVVLGSAFGASAASAAGSDPDRDSVTFTVDAAPVAKPFEITSPKAGSTVPAPSGSVTVTGTGTAGGIVTIDRGSTRVGTTTIAADGSWSITGTLPAGAQKLTVHHKKTPSSAASSRTLQFTVEQGAKAFAISSPEDGAVVQTADKQVTFTGTGKADALVKVLRGSRVVAQTTVPADGAWTATGELNYAAQDVAVFHKPAGSSTAAQAALHLTVAPIGKPFEVTSPKAGASLSAGPVRFTGTAGTDGTVSVFVGSKQRGTVAVTGGQTWSLDTTSLSAGKHTFVVYYKKTGSQSATSTSMELTLTK